MGKNISLEWEDYTWNKRGIQEEWKKKISSLSLGYFIYVGWWVH